LQVLWILSAVFYISKFESGTFGIVKPFLNRRYGFAFLLQLASKTLPEYSSTLIFPGSEFALSYRNGFKRKTLVGVNLSDLYKIEFGLSISIDGLINPLSEGVSLSNRDLSDLK
jgi:hypothetical protein